MIDTYEIYEELVPNLGDASARSIAKVVGRVYRDLSQAVTREDFNKLVVVVGELADAQKRTEQHLEELAEAQRRSEERIQELAEAQKRTEERLDSLTQKVEQLTEAQKKTEERLNSLSLRIEELAEAQRRSEERIEELAEAQRRSEERIEELAEAQKKTEERLDSLTQKVEQLTEAQKKTEERLNSLSLRVEELAEAQRRSEERIEELAEAQKRTEERLDSLTQKVEQLTEAQKKTEEKFGKLTEWVGTLHKRVEDISSSFGYHLENSAYRFLPGLLERHGILVQGRLIRRYIGQHQINIFGKAIRNGREIVILGECKTRPSVKEVKRFEKIVSYLQKEGQIKGDVILVFVAHDFPPEVENFLTERNLLYFWSYDLGPLEIFPH